MSPKICRSPGRPRSRRPACAAPRAGSACRSRSPTGLNAASFKGQLTWARRSLAIENAKIIIDGNEASGALALNLAGERPLVDGTLAFNAARPDALSSRPLRAQSFVFERLTSSWSEFDLSFPIIKHVDADLRVSAPKIAMSGYGFGRGRGRHHRALRQADRRYRRAGAARRGAGKRADDRRRQRAGAALHAARQGRELRGRLRPSALCSGRPC